MGKPVVLVIDDEAGPRESLRMILKPHYEVMLAESPELGLALAREHHPDVVFCDIKMPEMEGPEVLRRLKEIDPEIQVALITAYAAVDTAQKAVRYGAIDYITKPFSVEDILNVAQRAADRKLELQRQRLLIEQLQPAAAALSGQLDALGIGNGGGDSSAIYENLAAAHSSIESQLAKIGRLNAIGEVAAEVAHDVRNFLGAILLRIELLLMRLKQSDTVNAQQIQEDLQHIVQAAQDGTEAVQRIAGLTKSDPYEPSALVDLNSVVQEVVGIAGGQFQPGSGREIIVEEGHPPLVMASATALRTVLMNLVINARQALKEEGGVVRLSTAEEDGEAVIRVQDNGQGIPPELMSRITEPFFTTKGENGSGLGLSVAQKVVATHSGTLTFDSEVGVGTTVTIRLPAAAGARPDADAADTGLPEVTVPDVLVVEDDERVLNSMRAVLLAGGMTADGAADAGEGLEKFERYLGQAGCAPHAVVTDLRLPGLLGTDLARRIKELSPSTRVVLVSAYVGEQASSASSPYVDAIISKPFEALELLDKVSG
ncbi:MAG: response regulator [Armatimonadetes bacterium]|nr:response regulator [Armatimonadota bacterium]